MDDDLNRRYNAAFDMLPTLTRAVYMLSRIDGLAYADIGWRCGMSLAEVELRLADALYGMCQALDDRPGFAMRARSALRPWRASWAAWRVRARDRRLGITPRRYGDDRGERDSRLPHFPRWIRGLARKWRQHPP